MGAIAQQEQGGLAFLGVTLVSLTKGKCWGWGVHWGSSVNLSSLSVNGSNNNLIFVA